jgi:hypothetical protein
MADAPNIKVKLTAEDAGVSAAIRELSAQLKTLKKSEDEVTSSSLSLKSAFSGIASIAAGVKIEELGRQAFNSAVSIGLLSDKTGISSKTLSVFQNVAGNVGVSTESINTGLVRAARSITEFELGSVKAVQAFKLLGITQKDFANLNSDQKLALVTERLGHMEAGFAKATATQIIFGRSGTELIPVLNNVAAQGFDKATEATKKFGLLLDQDTTDSFRAAKDSLQDLGDIAQGVATQFEAGILPAVTDASSALSESLTQGGISFRDLGSYAGEVVRGIALVFLGLGQTIGTVAGSIYEVFHFAWEQISGDFKNTFDVAALAVGGKFSEASDLLAAHAKQNLGSLSDELSRQKAIFGTLGDSLKSDVANLFPSDAEEERRRKERAGRIRPERQTPSPEITAAAPPTDAAARAALALLQKQLEDELAIHRAYAAQVEQIELEQYDRGELSLKEYYDRRRAAAEKDAQEEAALLQRGVVAAQEAAQKAAVAKTRAATPKDADKQEAARLQALQKVDELQTRITEIQINSATKIKGLNDEQFKKQNDNQEKVLSFEKEINTSRNDQRAAAQQEIAIETQRLAIILKQQGLTQQQTDTELARYRAAKESQVEFTETQSDGAAALKLLADQRAEIEDRVKTGQLYEVQGQQQIRDLEQSRLPVLQQIAAQLLAQAQATGDDQKIAQAADFQKQVTAISVQANTVGQQIATIKQGLSNAVTGGITGFFNSLLEGTRSVSQAFRGLAASVIGSLAQMAAQMVAQIVLTKLLKAALGGSGFAGGGSVAAAPGHAEGGLIRGPGGPKSDSIPARVSPGEYIVQADAVKQFGVSNLEAINRGLKIPSLERLALPKYAEGGLVGNAGVGGGDSQIHLGIGLDDGLILKHLSSKQAGNIILQHLSNNPKAAQKALSRSD